MGIDPTERLLGATVTGGIAGFVTGSLRSVWNEPLQRAQMTPQAMMQIKSFKIVGSQTALFAGVGAVFVGGTMAAETIRGKDDMVNHMIGGCAAGTLFGMKHGSVKMGAIACPLFAFTTAMVDLSGETFRGGREQFVQKNPMLAQQYDAAEKKVGGH